MNRSRVVPVVLAVLAVSALGVASTTIETTLTTDPDDAIDPDWDRLPIGQGEAATIQNEIAEGEGDGEGRQSDDESEPVEDGGGSGDAEVAPSDGDSGIGGDGPGSGSWTRDGTDESTSLGGLAAPLLLLIVLLGIGGAVIVGGATYRYRAELGAVLCHESTTESSVASPPAAESWPGVEPSNVVDRAWLAVVDRGRPEHPETMTVAECVARAREGGSDATAVESIATAFRRVHYGSSPVAEEERRARVGLRRLDGDDG